MTGHIILTDLPIQPGRMPVIHHDGGRQAAGFKGTAGDCAVRAIAIVTEKTYMDVYNDINALGKLERRRKHMISSARNGVRKDTIRKYMTSLGWKHVATMGIGTGCKVHLRFGELPMGRLVVNVSGHTVAVIDNIIYDTYDPSRSGTRCVYGYYIKENKGV